MFVKNIQNVVQSLINDMVIVMVYNNFHLIHQVGHNIVPYLFKKIEKEKYLGGNQYTFAFQRGWNETYFTYINVF